RPAFEKAGRLTVSDCRHAGSAAEVRLQTEIAAPSIGIIDVEVIDIDDFRNDVEVVDQLVVDVDGGREVLEVVIANFEVERGLLVEGPSATDPHGPVALPLAVIVRAVAIEVNKPR